MNVGRVKQILDSPEEILVYYEGEPVWIQNVDEARQTARVYNRQQPDQEKEVLVTDLKE